MFTYSSSMIYLGLLLQYTKFSLCLSIACYFYLFLSYVLTCLLTMELITFVFLSSLKAKAQIPIHQPIYSIHWQDSQGKLHNTWQTHIVVVILSTKCLLYSNPRAVREPKNKHKDLWNIVFVLGVLLDNPSLTWWKCW